MELTVNLAGLDPAVRHSVVRGIQLEDRARFLLDLLEQRKAAQFAQAVASAKYTGELRAKAIFSPFQAHLCRQKYGPQCFADPEWMPWLLKKPEHADHRVKDAGSKIMSGWSAGRTGDDWRKPAAPAKSLIITARA